VLVVVLALEHLVLRITPATTYASRSRISSRVSLSSSPLGISDVGDFFRSARSDFFSTRGSGPRIDANRLPPLFASQAGSQAVAPALRLFPAEPGSALAA
jgi:hypothetical protein